MDARDTLAADQYYQKFLGCASGYSESGVVLFGAPFDSTTSYRPGTRFAPRTVRAESYGFETYSPYQDRDLADLKVHDAGDLELPFGDTSKALDMISDHTEKIFTDGKLPVMVGGEHLVTLGALRAAFRKYPDLRIIQFDAHADLRDEYLGVSLSHATVMRRGWDLTGPGRLYQFGIRSGDREEFLFAAESENDIRMRKFDFTGLDEVISEIKGKPVYLTVDLDVLDPSVFPGTGTPEAGGVSFAELHQAILSVCRGSVVIGADMNELAPNYDVSGASTASACKLLREMLISLA